MVGNSADSVNEKYCRKYLMMDRVSECKMLSRKWCRFHEFGSSRIVKWKWYRLKKNYTGTTNEK